MPWWLTRLYDEMMEQDMLGELAEYAQAEDVAPAGGWFPVGAVRIERPETPVPPPAGLVIDADPEPVVVRTVDGIPPPKYDVPEYDGREDSKPVSYVPARTLGMKIRKASPPRRDQPEQ